MTSSALPSTHRRRGGWIVLTLLVSTAVLAMWFYREATAVPDFYAEALAAPVSDTSPEEAADSLEREVLTLQNQMQRAEPWQLVLKEEEINAWLVADLAEKMPNLLPREVKDPRVVVENGTLYFACRHEKAFDGVLSLVLEPRLTKRANEVAIRVKSFSLGRLPVPQKQYLDQVSLAAARANVALRWEEEDGVAVALVQVPSEHGHLENRNVRVQSLEVREGEVVITGTAERSLPATARTEQRTAQRD